MKTLTPTVFETNTIALESSINTQKCHKAAVTATAIDASCNKDVCLNRPFIDSDANTNNCQIYNCLENTLQNGVTSYCTQAICDITAKYLITTTDLAKGLAKADGCISLAAC